MRQVTPGEAKAPPQGYLDIFGAKGFRIIADLVQPGDEELGLKALQAIKDAVRKYRRPENPRQYGFGPFLNDEAATPFWDLLSDDRPEIRAWAIWKALDYVQVTPLTARKLIGALEHKDPAVSSIAARHLMIRRYLPAGEKLKVYLAKLPKKEEQLAQDIRSYLQGRMIEDHLGEMGDQFTTQITKSLTPRHT